MKLKLSTQIHDNMGKAKKASGGNTKKDPGDLRLDPAVIRFTHSKIRPFFSGCGRKIEDTLNDILEGRLTIEQLPLILVLPINGEYFSLNNRRLYVMKELRDRGLLNYCGNEVSVRIKTALPKEQLRYTPQRCSLVAKIMRERDPNSAPADGDDDDDLEDEEGDAAGEAQARCQAEGR
jgi:hypothetical protein